MISTGDVLSFVLMDGVNCKNISNYKGVNPDQSTSKCRIYTQSTAP